MSAPDPNENPPAEAGDSFIRSEALLLLLTFSVSLLTLLAGILRILLGVGRMFFALRVVVAMGLGGILVKFSCLIVSVFRHGIPPMSLRELLLPALTQILVG
jgi:hypothetical protein